MPEREEQHDRGGHEEDDDGEEPEPRTRPLPASLDPDPPACAVKTVRAIDRLGIDGRLVRDRRDPAGWLRHRGDCMAVQAPVDHTERWVG